MEIPRNRFCVLMRNRDRKTSAPRGGKTSRRVVTLQRRASAASYRVQGRLFGGYIIDTLLFQCFSVNDHHGHTHLCESPFQRVETLPASIFTRAVGRRRFAHASIWPPVTSGMFFERSPLDPADTKEKRRGVSVRLPTPT